jgi:uncharacterized membrane protein (UPF0127 family)
VTAVALRASIPCRTPGGLLRVRVARDFVARARGLLSGPPLTPDEALLIAPCSSIHTFGMGYPIDVIFLDRRARIVRVCTRVPRGRVRFCWGAAAVVETRSGQAARYGLIAGTELTALQPELGSRWREFKRRILRSAANS